MTNRQPVFSAWILLALGGCSAGSLTSSGAPTGSFTQAGLKRALYQFASPRPQWNGPVRAGWLSREAALGHYLIYVGNGSQVVMFPKRGFNRHPVGALSDGVKSAYGLFLSRDKDLYVSNWLNDSVTVYPRGRTAPSMTYSTDLNRPLYAVADARDVFVGNANDGKIIEYRKGNGTPIAAIKTIGVEVDGLAFDAAGDLYAAYRRSDDRSTGGVEMFLPGAQQGSDLGINVTAPQGVVVDDAGNLLVVETEGANRVDVFPPGATTPSDVVDIPGTPTQIQLGRKDHLLYVSDLDKRIYVTRYPGFKEVGTKIHNSLGEVQGLAVSPPGELHR
jgi:DNA-binding beta-propeller fold protein YncE